jgi:DNA-binding response OmpR family regulator
MAVSAGLPMRILIVETDLQFLAQMKRGLEQAGHQVTAANDGMGAWDYLTGTDPPDLLVTRLHLGSGSPPGTALGLQAQAHDPPIPVVYIPATAELADPEHGAILTKPFTITELVAVANRLLNIEARGGVLSCGA